MEKIRCTDRVKNKEVKHRVKGRRNILHAIKQETRRVRTAFYNTLLKEGIEGRIELTERRGRRRKQFLGDLKGKRKH